MKKRILSMVTILCLLIALFPVKVFAYDIWDYVDAASKCFIGIEYGKTYCGDTYFTTPVLDEDIDGVYWYYSGGFDQRSVLMPDESGRYKLEAGLGEIYVYVDMFSHTGTGTEIRVVINADHTDNDNNHVCDVCGDRLTNKCTDDNKNHKCDTCEAQMGTCEDADHDHKCDYGCGKTFGEHRTTAGKNTCSYCNQPVTFNGNNPVVSCGSTTFTYSDEQVNGKDKGWLNNQVLITVNSNWDYSYSGEWIPNKDIGVTMSCDKIPGVKQSCVATFTISGIPNSKLENVLLGYMKFYMKSPDAGRSEYTLNGGESIAIDNYDTVIFTIPVYVNYTHTHSDENKDHICDVETCKEKLSEHSGGTATCKDKAVCDYCKDEYGELEKTNHVGGMETRNAKEATCTEDGYTGDTYCVGCDTKLQDGKPITKLGHTDANKDHICDVETCKAKLSDHSGGTATCKDKAVCDYCGNKYGEVDSSNHTGGTEVRNAKEATCTEDGYTGDTLCKDCGEKLSEGASVDKTGHNYESKVTKEATTTSTGTKTYTCKNCGHFYEEEIAKLPSQSTSPKTGDETPLVATIVVTLLSAAALIGLVAYKKRGRYSAK